MAHVPIHAAPHSLTREQSLRVAGTTGMAMLPVFATTVIVLTVLEWDFLHETGWTVLDAHEVNYPSALARGDLGFVQSLNFFMLGVFAVIFGLGLRTQFVHRWSGAAATIGLATVGISGVLSSFMTDLPREPASWHGLLHGIGFILMLLGCVVAFIAGGLALRGAPGWNGYWAYSLLTTPLAIAVSAALSPVGQVSFYALVTVLLAWFAVIGMRLRQLA